MKKVQEQRKNTSLRNKKTSTSKTFPPFTHCQRTNHPPQKCWNGPDASNRFKRFKQDQPTDNAQER